MEASSIINKHEEKKFGGPLYIIGLVESSLEPLPKELVNSKKAVILSRRFNIEPKYLILDKSLFYEEMKVLKEKEKRGRPDIIHQFLLATQYSYLNLKGKLKVFIHTINNDIIEVNPITRIPKNYFQFVSLIQNLYKYKKVPRSGEALLILRKNVKLSEYLKEKNIEKPILLHEKAEKVEYNELEKFYFPPCSFLIGGFPHGDFSKDTKMVAWRSISLKKDFIMDAWMVADRIICHLEKYI
ncbi:16S rRNA methyltransferase [Fervidicoccus fontis]|uniref:Ribosomal RNA small subunit methyltransferase Nep1 n=2 Tax=Fervidicoccus fontis TaxID=683846 RepID=I0A2P8_FERFK|nr:ribosome biogenesis protein [Fervidicoccus fontis]AFH43255.1 ribosome biogenesis protein [Fervidicoccus fontis Kam940]MBE9390634.1 16S rRNA methyltransferase [Fervidicoccus fontis]